MYGFSPTRLVWLVLAVAWGVVAWPFLFDGSIVTELDTTLVALPIEFVYRQFQDHWQLPWWSSEFGFGHPLLAWGQLGFFVPVHLGLRAWHVDPVLLLALAAPTYLLVGLVGMFGFLRSRSLHPLAAAFGAAAFALNGFGAAHFGHVNFYVVTMLLPWLLWVLVSLVSSPALWRAWLLAVGMALVAENGHPTMVLFTFIIGGIVAVGFLISGKRSARLWLYLLLAGLLGFGLASIRTLPFLELFLESERAQGMLPHQLYEFSYPPWHAITLLWPRFFWNASEYVGPKNFAELGAYVGVIPLLLAGAALAVWRERRSERVIALVLVVVGGMLALGKYSAVYRELVTYPFWSAVGGTGRYMYLAVTGVAWLAALSLDDWLQGKWKHAQVGAAILFPILVLTPFVITAFREPALQAAWRWPQNIVGAWEVGVSVLVALLIFLVWPSGRRVWGGGILLTVAAMSLAWHHHEFYRLGPRAALQPAPTVVAELEQYHRDEGVPARIYARASVWQDRQESGQLNIHHRLSDWLGTSLRVIQPIRATENNLECVSVPLNEPGLRPTIDMEIRTGFRGETVRSVHGTGEMRDGFIHPLFCFEPIVDSRGAEYWVFFSADDSAMARMWIMPESQPAGQAYFVRVIEPTDADLARSRKNFQVPLQPVYAAPRDIDFALLESYAQVFAGASGARWLGSLPTMRSAHFLDTFFANNRTMVDGAGQHVLDRHRQLFDMAGVTHFSQLLFPGARDRLSEAGFPIVDRQDFQGKEVRLYTNPQAYPRAFLVPRGQHVDYYEHTFEFMNDAAFNPRTLAYLEGEVDPLQIPNSISVQGQAEITAYTSRRVDVSVQTDKPSVLVLTDTASPLWRTYLDGQLQPSLIANGVFRAAIVPAGMHTVSFTFYSPAVRLGTVVSGTSAVIVITGLLAHAFRYLKQT